MIYGIYILLIAHFLADYVFQTHYMATNKYKSIKALSLHIIVYSLVLGLVFFGVSWYTLTIGPITLMMITIGIVLFNGVTHYIIDYFTSKLTHYFYSNENYHDFFVVIGADQLFHTMLLIYSYNYIINQF